MRKSILQMPFATENQYSSIAQSPCTPKSTKRPCSPCRPILFDHQLRISLSHLFTLANPILPIGIYTPSTSTGKKQTIHGSVSKRPPVQSQSGGGGVAAVCAQKEIPAAISRSSGNALARARALLPLVTSDNDSLIAEVPALALQVVGCSGAARARELCAAEREREREYSSWPVCAPRGFMRLDIYRKLQFWASLLLGSGFVGCNWGC